MAQVDATRRSQMMLNRVVVTGSECTGKTTLAEKLAAHFHVPWVPEFSRQYAETKQGILDVVDVEPIARGQIDLEASIARNATNLLVLDTDLLSTFVYSHHYYSVCPDWIEDELWNHPASLYLLLAPDVPWLPDGVRDRGHMREEMHELFRNALIRIDARYREITGDWERRELAAIAAINDLMASASQQ